MQLLQITVNHMQCELQIENARLEYQQDFTPSADIQTTPAKLQIRTKPAQQRLDSYDVRRSLGFASVGDRIQDASEKGQNSLNLYIRGTVEEGSQMANIEDGVTIGQLINQKMLEQPTTITAFLPSGNLSIMWDAPEISTQVQQGDVKTEWDINQNTMSFVPGSVKLHITQYASVEVEYVGSPLYVPPSANPNYEEKSVG